MSNNQISMFDMPATIDGLNVTKIYITRGKNTVDDEGRICDRFCAVEIGGKLHWINSTFASLDELSFKLRGFKVVLCFDGAWGVTVDGRTPLNEKVVMLKQSEGELFGQDSNYCSHARAEYNTNDTIWWSIDDIKARYFSEIAA